MTGRAIKGIFNNSKLVINIVKKLNATHFFPEFCDLHQGFDTEEYELLIYLMAVYVRMLHKES